MMEELSVLTNMELLELRLRGLYEKAGYSKYRMGRFEEYGLYGANRRFLASEQVISFTDLDGRLLALKPDVTLSIAKNARIDGDGGCARYYYCENVYRPSQESHTFREISQMGLECIGSVDRAECAKVLRLALATLEMCGGEAVLEISHMGFVGGLLDALALPEGKRSAVIDCIRDKNSHELRKKALDAGMDEGGADTLCALTGLCGDAGEVLEKAEAMVRCDAMGEAVEALKALRGELSEGAKLKIDLSLVNDIDYYNGLVFRGYVAGAPRAVLQGGRYDPLAQQFTPGVGAIGFALYMDELERLETVEAASAEKTMLNVALPKGRLGDKVYALLSAAGYGCGTDYNDSRRLVVENPEAGIRYFLVKPSDVAIYVEHGAADIGIVGKDILAEAKADVYELLDTGLGKCRMCVAARNDFVDEPGRSLRVATKFVNIAKAYYASQGRDIDIIKLNGSIELAPLLGLSDVIVDIVETGTTLKENDLKVVTEFMPISARFIANKASYQFKKAEIDAITLCLSEVKEK
ncbi:MAG: ATP phosphoribosyltransferase [Oscillospiraceae bacterium]|nr:ATP phosphoribosyltransferase [Oscillospiraceae bacterium]